MAKGCRPRRARAGRPKPSLLRQHYSDPGVSLNRSPTCHAPDHLSRRGSGAKVASILVSCDGVQMFRVESEPEIAQRASCSWTHLDGCRRCDIDGVRLLAPSITTTFPCDTHPRFSFRRRIFLPLKRPGRAALRPAARLKALLMRRFSIETRPSACRQFVPAAPGTHLAAEQGFALPPFQTVVFRPQHGPPSECPGHHHGS